MSTSSSYSMETSKERQEAAAGSALPPVPPHAAADCSTRAEDHDSGSESQPTTSTSCDVGQKRRCLQNLKRKRPCPVCETENGMAARACSECGEDLKKPKLPLRKENFKTKLSTTALKAHVESRTNQLWGTHNTHCVTLYYSQNQVRDHVTIHATPGVGEAAVEAAGMDLINLWSKHVVRALSKEGVPSSKETTSTSSFSSAPSSTEAKEGVPSSKETTSTSSFSSAPSSTEAKEGVPSSKETTSTSSFSSAPSSTEEHHSSTSGANHPTTGAVKWYRLYNRDDAHVGNGHKQENMTTIHCHPVPPGCRVFEVVGLTGKTPVPLIHPFNGEHFMQKGSFIAWPLTLTKGQN
ncbi:uncharacterized protein DDB_G0271670-like [Patiria miniata]|uniref:Uncharacterized protein n=1 Tax=Patiria miniata TaxID=46514 RepID=A0A914B6X1_PATMI|nr:uncharacterized protein DDB_G0271670-like [Patiria miniata]